MGMFKKKPVVIEARQFDGRNTTELLAWMWPAGSAPRVLGGAIEINTLEGVMRADKNDWIIKGVHGEFYPCKPDIFAATYELA